MKRIAFFHTSLGHTAKVFKDTQWGEYRVKFYDEEGQHMKDSDYHTDCPEDASDTARAVLAFMKGQA